MEKIFSKPIKMDPLLYELFEFRPERKGDIKKMEIIKASIDCLATVGLENTTYEAIAKKIGTRRAHIAYHFNNKTDIFNSAIKYILATYQQISIEHINTAKNPKQMIHKYVEAAFEWARKFPNQASVLLLFNYLCSHNKEYLKLNDQVKKKGQKRIHYMLQARTDLNLSQKQLLSVSSAIQNLTISSIQDCLITNLISFESGQKHVINIIKSLLKAYEGKKNV